MGIAAGLDRLIPGAQYGGSLTANDQASYDDLEWQDQLTKPLWADVLASSAAIDLEQLKSDINDERDRRISAGFSVDFGGSIGVVAFDSDKDSRDNISAAYSLAHFAIVGGSQPGDLRWDHPDYDFGWIADDNSQIAMDADTCGDFCELAMGYKKAILFAARAIKDLPTIPTEYKNDQYWPSRALGII